LNAHGPVHCRPSAGLTERIDGYPKPPTLRSIHEINTRRRRNVSLNAAMVSGTSKYLASIRSTVGIRSTGRALPSPSPRDRALRGGRAQRSRLTALEDAMPRLLMALSSRAPSRAYFRAQFLVAVTVGHCLLEEAPPGTRNVDEERATGRPEGPSPLRPRKATPGRPARFGARESPAGRIARAHSLSMPVHLQVGGGPAGAPSLNRLRYAEKAWTSTTSF
jgi:hypothetical protein